MLVIYFYVNCILWVIEHKLNTTTVLKSFLKWFEMVHTSICKPETDAVTFSTVLRLQSEVAAVMPVVMNYCCLHASEYWNSAYSTLSSGPCYHFSANEQTDVPNYQENLFRYSFWCLFKKMYNMVKLNAI